MKKIQKVLAMLLALMMILSVFSACGAKETPASTEEPEAAPATTEEAPAEEPEAEATEEAPEEEEAPAEEAAAPKVFAMNISENLKTLDPHYQLTLAGKAMTQMYLDSLILYDETTGEFIPWLCEDYEFSEDGLEWTFYMKEGITFTNGEALDANDVAYSFERLLADKEGSQIASQYWSQLASVELIDDLTVKITTAEPVANIRVGLSKTYIIPDEAHKADGDALFSEQRCPASGPWILEEWIDGQHVYFTKNENYWNKDWFDSYYDRVEINMITESSTAITAHVAGDVQAYIPSSGIPVDMLPLYAGTEDKTELISFISGTYAYVGMSFKEGSPFLDENFRWAFEYAIDRQSIVDNILGGGLVPNSEALNVCLGYNPDLEPYVYDPDLAKEYLAKSSYNGEPFEIVTNNGFNKSEDIALFLSECLNEVGMNTTVRVVEVAELQSIRAEGTYDCFIVNNMHGCGDIGNDMMMRLVNDAHHSFYSGEGYDELSAAILASAKELDVEKRAELIKEAMSILRKNAAPQTFLCQYESTFAIDYGVTGLEPFADGTFRFTYVTYDPTGAGNEFPDFSQFIK